MDGKISVFDLIKIKAEEKKRMASNLKWGLNRKKDSAEGDE